MFNSIHMQKTEKKIILKSFIMKSRKFSRFLNYKLIIFPVQQKTHRQRVVDRARTLGNIGPYGAS